MTDLSGSVVVVTGAAGDQGKPTAAAFAAAGATVVAAGRDAARLAEVVALDPEHIVASVVDLSNESATQEWARMLLAEHGRVDGLMHLVGGWRGGKGIVESDLGDWDFLHLNLIRTLQHATRALHDPLLQSPHGRAAIISTSGLNKPRATNAAYLTAKAGAEMWLRAVADSFAGSDAAAAIGRIMALVTPQMQAAKPDGYQRFTPVETIADWLVGLYDRPAVDVNGVIETINR
ncbi:SDR family NAD(P)-dependent oxidoreductase [Flexivirga caeni]|uniref:SDR family NAD(P)-dependent oxidoreductase n=1 Tax=Flexivirga caeni TaxID=2294115 RepID=A0A3M9MG31_9MICO|nr:SDR family NAD(P)-dependent oxidoreductase [Flexivirga caeni]RNI23843.1 SDR family NAD(P)-dependent oxidoreductase [Flexivirga caeni]